MATLKVGRAGIDVSLESPATVTLNGQDVSVSGSFSASTLADAQALRDQIRGLMSSPDEPVVPFVWSEDDTITGFITDIQTSVSTVGQGSYSAFWFNYSIQGRLIDNAARPQAESTLLGGLRSNYQSITTAKNWWGAPRGILDGGFSTSTQSRTSEDGTITIGLDAAASSITPANNLASYLPDPSHWYDGSAKLELLHGSNYRAVHGRELPPTDAGAAAAWRFGNGIVRMYPTGTQATLIMEGYSAGSAWKTLATIVPSISTDSTDISSISISRSTPAVSSIRLGIIANGVAGVNPGVASTIDILLRRGAPFFETSSALPSLKYRFVGETGSNITAGMRRSADDANGNRWFTYAAGSLTTSTASSALITNTSTPSAIAIGGSIASNGDGTLVAQDQYFSTLSESVNFVTR